MIRQLFIFTILVVIVSMGCYKDEYYTDSTAKLRFSTDTLSFDTVFTARGSATKILKIYNDYDQAIKISKIEFASNKNNQFRLNIDGLSTNSAEDVEIGANDSIYIFAETHINPDDPLSISPFIISDSILFTTNGNSQNVFVQAWGQNANYINTAEIGKLSCNLGEIIWDDPKPYVVYGILRIDSCKLTLPEGTRVYMHGGINKDLDGNYYYDGNIYVYKSGKLNIKGTAENPVIIQTDRLEQEYQDINALWYGIFILPESKGNYIEHAEIKNATIGLYIDSLATVDLKSTKILHTGAIGIYNRHATVNAENCLIADIGSYNVVVDYGGVLNMSYCTIYNNNSDDALAVKNYKCLDDDCFSIEPYPVYINMENCIVYGENSDEILFSNGYADDPSFFQYNFDHCLIGVEDLLEVYPYFYDNCQSCIDSTGDNNLFVDIENYNYRPDTMSVVIDKAKVIQDISDDIEGFPRGQLPDIGCYEFH
ncbi:MAG: hypothetical protein R2771_12410 [Saprospiraceae bacterium]